MNEATATKIDVWSHNGLEKAANDFFDGNLPDRAIDNLPYTEQRLVCIAIKRDSRVYSEALRPAVNLIRTTQKALDKTLPSYVPRDKITKAFVTAASTAYIADIWDPLPIGESIAAIFLGAATLRGKYLNRKNNDHTPK